MKHIQKKNCNFFVFAKALCFGSLILFFILTNSSFAQLYYSPHEETDTTTVAFSPDGNYILSARFLGDIRLWKKDSCELQGISLVHDPRISPQNPDSEYPPYLSMLKGILSIAWSPDGEKFAFGMRDHTVRLYSFHPDNDGHRLFKELKVFEEPRGGIRAVAFSPNGQLIASGGHDGTIYLWNIRQKGKAQVYRFCCHTFWINALDFSSDGKFLVSGSSDGKIKVWEIPSGKLLESFDVLDQIYSVKFSPDVKQIAVGTAFSVNKSTIFIWDTVTYQEKMRFQGHAEAVWSLSFSPDSKSMASGGFIDGKIIIWDLSSGKQTKELIGPDKKQIRSLSYSPDGKYIVSGVTSGPLPLWDLEIGEVIREFGRCPT